MKMALPALLALLLLTSLVACNTPASTTPLPTPSPAPTQTETAMTSVVTFADSTLELIVRGAIGKPSGDITVAEAKTVTSMNLAYAEWQKYISEKKPISSIAGLEHFTSLESLDLSGNTITDIAPLSALTNLKALILTGCTAESYTPLAGLANLRVLMLDHSTIANPEPLLALTDLKCLYLKGSRIRNFFPLADILTNLEQADFDVAFTLAELGFNFNDGDILALYQTDKYDIRINHSEWGEPPQQDWQDCIVVVTSAESGYKNAIAFNPSLNTYLISMFNTNTQINYTYEYNVATNSFNCDRLSMETIVRDAFDNVNNNDVLLTPIVFFDSIIQDALGIPIEILYNMPFDENLVLKAKTPYEALGFEFDEKKGTYYFQKYGLDMAIHKPEWDKDVAAEDKPEWNMCFIDTNVKGHYMRIVYFADRNLYGISLEKDGIEIKYEYFPATDTFEYDPKRIEPLQSGLIEVLGVNFMKETMKFFETTVRQRFDMSIEEFYALSIN